MIISGFDNNTLACLFGVDKSCVQRCWWKCLLHHYHFTNSIPKLWSTANLQDEEIDRVFDKVYAEQDPQYKTLCHFVEDPRYVAFFVLLFVLS